MKRNIFPKFLTISMYAIVVQMVLLPLAAVAQDVTHPGNVTVSGRLGVGRTPSDTRFLLDLKHPSTPTMRIESSASGISPSITLRSTSGYQNQWNIVQRSYEDDKLMFVQGGGNEAPALTMNGPLVGIGTKFPNVALHIVNSTVPILRLETSKAVSPKIELRPDSSYNDQWNIILDDADANKLKIRQSPSGTPAIICDGTNVTVGNQLSAAVVEIRGAGNDLAEGFVVHNSMGTTKPGMVVSISSEKVGEMEVSTTAYDRKVAGIISGAGDLRVGIQLGDAEEVARGELTPVALSGRVWCYADASLGAISPGDLLTTSPTPGHAMKVRDYQKAPGATIGKAMSSLDSGQGMVLVLVSLQ